MMYFDCGDARYHLRHHNDDDSRTVVQCRDFDFKILLRFNSSLLVLDGAGKHLGHLLVDRDTDSWTLVKPDSTVIDLGVACRDYHWDAITKAEVEASKFLLKAAP
jgi:hypothetical protein